MKRKHLYKLLLLAQAGALLLLLALPAPARAANIEINVTPTTLSSFYNDLNTAIGGAGLGDTIEVVFDLGTTAAALENYAALSITRDLTIIFRSAGGKLTLFPDGSRRHLSFDIDTDVTLTLIFADVILDGGNVRGGIQATGFDGKLVLQKAVIQNCLAGIGGGGGVYALGDLEISGSSFTGNQTDGAGGGVYALGDLEISGSSFTGNQATSYGGGVYAMGKVEIKDGSVFAQNTAGLDGGGVYTWGAGSTIKVSDSSFTGNQASGDGGAIWLDLPNAATLIFSDPLNRIRFEDNLAGRGYIIDDSAANTSPYNAWHSIEPSAPFSHIANNYDLVYNGGGGSGSLVYTLNFYWNDGQSGLYKRLDLTQANWADGFPPEPTRGGYTFTGWNEAADGSGAEFTAQSTVPSGSNHQVYAQWRRDTAPVPDPEPEPEPEPEPTPSGGAADRERSDSYPVRFDLNGGGTALTRYAQRGGTLTAPADPTRAGYEFTGWYTDAACTSPYDFAQSVTGGFTLYAGWRAVAAPIPADTHSAYIDGYPDGSFRPEGSLTRAEAAGMLYRLLGEPQADGAGFADVTADAWYEAAVGALNGRGLLTGYADGSFRPNAPVTRAEFVTLALRYAGESASTGGAGFADADGHWAAGAIAAAVEAGYVSGYADGTFRPEAPVTRAEAVAILNRVIGCEGVREGAGFSDVSADYWAYADILAASTEHGH